MPAPLLDLSEQHDAASPRCAHPNTDMARISSTSMPSKLEAKLMRLCIGSHTGSAGCPWRAAHSWRGRTGSAEKGDSRCWGLAGGAAQAGPHMLLVVKALALQGGRRLLQRARETALELLFKQRQAFRSHITSQAAFT